jgi:hypothetical protein
MEAPIQTAISPRGSNNNRPNHHNNVLDRHGNGRAQDNHKAKTNKTK